MGVYRYKKGRHFELVELESIRYISCYGRKITLHTTTGNIEYTGRLKETFAQVNYTDFVQINRSEIVNLHYARRTDYKSVILDTHEALPVTENYRQNLACYFLNIKSVY